MLTIATYRASVSPMGLLMCPFNSKGKLMQRTWVFASDHTESVEDQVRTGNMGAKETTLQY